MTDEEVIRKAVEYAERWEFYSSDYHESGGEVSPPYGGCWWLYELPSMFLDALAAQLVRQIDELPKDKYIELQIMEDYTNIDSAPPCRCMHDCYRDSIAEAEGPDRTMNTLNACVAFFDKQ